MGASALGLVVVAFAADALLGDVRRTNLLLPPLVLLIVIYSGLPFAGIRMTPFMAVCIGLLLNAPVFLRQRFRPRLRAVRQRRRGAATTSTRQKNTAAGVKRLSPS